MTEVKTKKIKPDIRAITKLVPPAGNLVQGAESIAYTYASVNGGDGTGMGAAQAKDLTVTVTVNQANAANVAAGTYTDTIAITLAP